MTEPLSRTMSGQLAVRLRDRILSGSYAPGAPLLQDSIAAEFGVSKIPVREALVQLQGEGLVEIFAHRGFQVRPLSASELEEVFSLRLRMEPTAVAGGARRASAADQQAARMALDHLNETLAAGNLDRSGALNRAFHLSLIVPRLQPVAAQMLGRLHTLSQRYVQMHLLPLGRVKRATREHTELHEAWAARKLKRVVELTRAHIETTRNDLRSG